MRTVIYHRVALALQVGHDGVLKFKTRVVTADVNSHG
jgi:hypothetical protein